jgi:hypothetical protein
VRPVRPRQLFARVRACSSHLMPRSFAHERVERLQAYRAPVTHRNTPSRPAASPAPFLRARRANRPPAPSLSVTKKRARASADSSVPVAWEGARVSARSVSGRCVSASLAARPTHRVSGQHRQSSPERGVLHAAACDALEGKMGKGAFGGHRHLDVVEGSESAGRRGAVHFRSPDHRA